MTAGKYFAHRELVRRLHASGPRPVYELLAEIAARDPEISAFIAHRLETYTAISPGTYRLAGADDWRAVQ